MRLSCGGRASRCVSSCNVRGSSLQGAAPLLVVAYLGSNTWAAGFATAFELNDAYC